MSIIESNSEKKRGRAAREVRGESSGAGKKPKSGREIGVGWRWWVVRKGQEEGLSRWYGGTGEEQKRDLFSGFAFCSRFWFFGFLVFRLAQYRSMKLLFGERSLYFVPRSIGTRLFRL
jgi:hypothetical protein